MSLSNEGIQLGAKWQFWKNTQCPLSIACFIKLSAIGPYNIYVYMYNNEWQCMYILLHIWQYTCTYVYEPVYMHYDILVYNCTCPWPREMAVNFFKNFISSANLYRSAAGSVPDITSTHTHHYCYTTYSYVATYRSLEKIHRWIFSCEICSW